MVLGNTFELHKFLFSKLFICFMCKLSNNTIFKLISSLKLFPDLWLLDDLARKYIYEHMPWLIFKNLYKKWNNITLQSYKRIFTLIHVKFSLIYSPIVICGEYVRILKVFSDDLQAHSCEGYSYTKTL